ncbi:MAG: AAA family ATPase [Lachnospiraceae bacterium]|nr:AAA family ATPase [Lachnospiraceae bacterium]
MSETLGESIGLIIGKKNYVLLDAAMTLPTNEKSIDIGTFGGDIEIEVTKGNSTIPSEVHVIGRGKFRIPRRQNKTKLTLKLRAEEAGRICLSMFDTMTGTEAEEVFSPVDFGNGETIVDSVEQTGSKQISEKEDHHTDEAPSGLSAEKLHVADRQINEEIEKRFAQKKLIGLGDVKRVLSAQYNTLLMSDDLRRKGVGTGELPNPWNFFIGGGSGSGKHSIAQIISELLHDACMTDQADPLIVNAIGLDPGNPAAFFDEINGEGRSIVIENCELLIPEEESTDNNKLWLHIYEVLQAAQKQQDRFFIFLGQREPFEKKLRTMPQLARMATSLSIMPYETGELKSIALRFLSEYGLKLAPGAENAFDRAIRNEAILDGFAGAHSLKILIGNAVNKKSFRYVNGTQDKLLIDEDFFDAKDGGKTLDDLLKELDDLTGLAVVKEEVRNEIISIRGEKELGLQRKDTMLHMMFLGNPGTGKTTVARLIAQIYGKLGLLPKPDLFIEVDRSALVGAYQGHTERNTLELIKKAMGGVLFIDEAHRIVSGDQDDFGKQALGVLIKNMWDYRDRFMVIFAGYDNMEQILSQYEPGIVRRIHRKLHFDDYSQDELFTIFLKKLKKNRPPMIPDEEAEQEARTFIRERSSAPDFGNGGGVENIAEDVMQCVMRRLVLAREEKIRAGETEPEDLSNVPSIPVLAEDIRACGGKATAGPTLEDYERKLNGMIGLSRIKEEVVIRENQILMERERLRQGLPPSDDFLLHAVFYGNAGTGKTTVAKLIAKIYNKMGVLPAGDIFVEAKRSDLVAEYMGQTAIKTTKLVKTAIGGVLFIDEAYALCTGEKDEFGLEALNTLLTLAVDYRDRLMIILAGYEEPMNRLLSLNQGLDRRFPNRFHFADYSQDELYAILLSKLKDNGRTLSSDAEEPARKLIEMRSARSGFGNGGGIDNIIKDFFDAQATRLRADLIAGNLPPEKLSEITLADVEKVIADQA